MTPNGVTDSGAKRIPEIRYARSGDTSIAYYVLGEQPRDLVLVHGFAGNLEAELEEPWVLAFNERVSSFARLIRFDRRGTGMSDRVRDIPSLETRMDDVRAVVDAVGAKRAALFGTFEAASMCMLFAATYPERTSGLVLYNPVAKGTWSPEYPWARTAAEWLRFIADEGDRWGTPEYVEEFVRTLWPARIGDDEFKRLTLRKMRLGASPAGIRAIRRMGWRSTCSTCCRRSERPRWSSGRPTGATSHDSSPSGSPVRV